MRPAIISVSSRAAARACTTPEALTCLGVRKNGSLRVTRPFTAALPMVCVSASPATAAALLKSYHRQRASIDVLRHLRVPAGGDPRRRAVRILSKCRTLLRADP
jgi:hypothetical protein